MKSVEKRAQYIEEHWKLASAIQLVNAIGGLVTKAHFKSTIQVHQTEGVEWITLFNQDKLNEIPNKSLWTWIELSAKSSSDSFSSSQLLSKMKLHFSQVMSDVLC